MRGFHRSEDHMYLSPFINLELKLVNSISLAYQLKI
jgi:hypothetical protein